jgi:hypothetical protein
VACGTEQGRLLISDYFQTSNRIPEQYQPIVQTYYSNFPQGSDEKLEPTLIWPFLDIQVHQNSIFDLIFLERHLVTASGDQTGAVVDFQSGQIV